MDDDDIQFVSYKKLLIFHTEYLGKTSLNKIFKKWNAFSNETHEENGKLK